MDLCETLRPFVQHPVIPIERETMHGNRLKQLQHTEILHPLDKSGIDRRNAAEHARQGGIDFGHGFSSDSGHLSEAPPFWIKLEIPMRFVIGLVPKHDGFNHNQLTSL